MLDLDPAIVQNIEAADEVRQTLSDRIRATLGSQNGARGVTRVEVSVPGRMRPVDWIRAQEVSETVYWSGRDDERTVAAVGAADVLESDESPIDYEEVNRALARRLSDSTPSARYFGGMRFDAMRPATGGRPGRRWGAFRTYRFVLPRFELVENGDTRTLACNLILPEDTGAANRICEAVDNLAFPVPSERSPLPRPYRRRDVPERDGWTRMIRWALRSIDEGSLDKVVLARRVALALDDSMDPLLVLSHLEAATPGCYHFAVRPEQGPAFIGASPEQLFRRDGDCVISEAVAGTRPRGTTDEEDAAYRRELLESPKERREHAFVQEAIREALERVCTSVQIPNGRGELALARGRHLRSRLTGTLEPDTSTTDLLDVLHPTPAVGGVPNHDAVSAIRAQEPFDRGWYAGPMGWVGPNEAEFAVALRAGLVREDRIALFSGAGIVDGSEPEQEWDEIEQKIGDFAAIMGVTEPSDTDS